MASELFSMRARKSFSPGLNTFALWELSVIFPAGVDILFHPLPSKSVKESSGASAFYVTITFLLCLHKVNNINKCNPDARANASSFLPSLSSSLAFYPAGIPDLAHLHLLLLQEEGRCLEVVVLQTVKWLLTQQCLPQCNSHASGQPAQT